MEFKVRELGWSRPDEYCCETWKGYIRGTHRVPYIEWDEARHAFTLSPVGWNPRVAVNYCPFCGQKIEIVEIS